MSIPGQSVREGAATLDTRHLSRLMAFLVGAQLMPTRETPSADGAHATLVMFIHMHVKPHEALECLITEHTLENIARQHKWH